MPCPPSPIPAPPPCHPHLHRRVFLAPIPQEPTTQTTKKIVEGKQILISGQPYVRLGSGDVGLGDDGSGGVELGDDGSGGAGPPERSVPGDGRRCRRRGPNSAVLGGERSAKPDCRPCPCLRRRRRWGLCHQAAATATSSICRFQGAEQRRWWRDGSRELDLRRGSAAANRPSSRDMDP
ncbi:hypothetical protein E2562_001920 [Oryza meyeriana var. granulata]|uniref:Uncharacterized protein n=1 Tax=Oryza meyeriana var. granulata TaxID=110450 RepID=A0A6G1C475_9ORYZ|nr:hypothetical protein E2562_001920 [Oryza meyeriana var. granulata]